MITGSPEHVELYSKLISKHENIPAENRLKPKFKQVCRNGRYSDNPRKIKKGTKTTCKMH